MVHLTAVIKTGSSGLIAYRLIAKDFRWVWLQTSSKVTYKNSKPDYIMCTHRHLTYVHDVSIYPTTDVFSLT